MNEYKLVFPGYATLPTVPPALVPNGWSTSGGLQWNPSAISSSSASSLPSATPDDKPGGNDAHDDIDEPHTYVTQAESARKVRAAFKAAFPKVKISVRCHGDIRIEWED